MTFIPSMDLISIGEGKVTGHVLEQITGISPQVTNAAFTDIWNTGGTMVFPTAGETWEILSDDANDTSAGTGARTVVVISLDTNYDRQTEIVTMNGTTPVALTGTHFRTHQALVLTAGSNEVNVGELTIRVSGGGNVRAKILADNGTAYNSQYTVPAGKSVFTLQIVLTTPKGEDALIRTRARAFRTDPSLFSPGFINAYQNTVVFPITGIQRLPEKTDIWLQAQSTNAGPIRITGVFSFLLVDNTVLP